MGKYVRYLMLGAACLVAGEIFVNGMLDQIAGRSPDTALKVAPNNSKALVQRTENEVAFSEKKRLQSILASATNVPSGEKPQSNSDGVIQNLPGAVSGEPEIDKKKLRKDIGIALLSDPVNPHALRLLGQLEKEDAAQPAMRLAVALSKREAAANLWLAEFSRKKNDYETTMGHLDLILRSQPIIVDQLSPVLISLIENQHSNEAAMRLLRSDPPWLSYFFNTLAKNSNDLRTPLVIFNDLESNNISVGQTYKNHYINYIWDKQQYEFAYDTWLQFLPTESLRYVKNVFNGDFVLKPSGSIFDWTLTPGDNTSVNIVFGPGDSTNPALFVEHGNGQNALNIAKQIIKLPAGKYEFTAGLQGKLAGKRGHVWTVQCIPDAVGIVGQSDLVLGNFNNGSNLKFFIEIPDQKCPLQILQLGLAARSPSEQYLSGSIAYRHIAINRMDN